MHKKHILGILIIMFAISNSIFPEDASIGKIESTFGHIIVQVYCTGSVWVGCTVFPNGLGGYEIDLEAQKLRGSGTVKFNLLPHMSIQRGSIDYVVALWKDKLSLSECKKKYGSDTSKYEWALRNKYQMDGLIDRDEGSYAP